MRDITSAVGINKGSLYSYIKSKRICSRVSKTGGGRGYR
jgi:AcrR family transcriptional regulator